MTTTTKQTQSIRRSCSCRYIHLVQHFANSVSQIFLPYLLHAISMHYRKATCHTKHQCTLKCYRIKQICLAAKHFSIWSYLISIYEQDSWSCGKLSNWDVFFMLSFFRRNKEHFSYFDKISHSVSLSSLVLVIWSMVHVDNSGR